MLDKRVIAARFGRSAGSYDASAEVQRLVGSELIDRVADWLPVNRSGTLPNALDLGCGTGRLLSYLCAQCALGKVVAMDISQEMVVHARRTAGLEDVQFLCADMEAWPFIEHQRFGLVFSNYALQWCHRIDLLLSQIREAMLAGGVLAIAIPGQGTLSEIQRSWAEVDNEHRVNRFASKANWQSELKKAGFKTLWQKEARHTLYYDSVEAALSALKRSGVPNALRQRCRHVTGVKRFKRFTQAYQSQQHKSLGIPMTYNSYSFVVTTDGC